MLLVLLLQPPFSPLVAPICSCSCLAYILLLQHTTCIHVVIKFLLCSIQSNWRGYVARRWYKSYRDKVPPTNPQLRAKHFEKKLSKVTEQILDSCSQRSNQVEILLAQSDSTLSACREAMKRCEEQLMAGELDWEAVRVKARQHLASDCSVCLCPLQLCQPYSMPRLLSVLSCGHLLHEICIKALEKFSNEGTVHLCPLCRTPYQRTSWGSSY